MRREKYNLLLPVLPVLFLLPALLVYPEEINGIRKNEVSVLDKRVEKFLEKNRNDYPFSATRRFIKYLESRKDLKTTYNRKSSAGISLSCK